MVAPAHEGEGKAMSPVCHPGCVSHRNPVLYTHGGVEVDPRQAFMPMRQIDMPSDHYGQLAGNEPAVAAVGIYRVDATWNVWDHDVCRDNVEDQTRTRTCIGAPGAAVLGEWSAWSAWTVRRATSNGGRACRCLALLLTVFTRLLTNLDATGAVDGHVRAIHLPVLRNVWRR